MGLKMQCFLGHLYGHKSRVATVRSEGLSEVTRFAMHDLSVNWEQERVTAQATRSAEKHRKKKVESADGESLSLHAAITQANCTSNSLLALTARSAEALNPPGMI